MGSCQQVLVFDPQDWNSLSYPAELTEVEFSVKEEANQWLIDIQGKRLTTRFWEARHCLI